MNTKFLWFLQVKDVLTVHFDTFKDQVHRTAQPDGLAIYLSIYLQYISLLSQTSLITFPHTLLTQPQQRRFLLLPSNAYFCGRVFFPTNPQMHPRKTPRDPTFKIRETKTKTKKSKNFVRNKCINKVINILAQQYFCMICL